MKILTWTNYFALLIVFVSAVIFSVWIYHEFIIFYPRQRAKIYVVSYEEEFSNLNPVGKIKLFLEGSREWILTLQPGAVVNLQQGENRIIYNRFGFFGSHPIKPEPAVKQPSNNSQTVIKQPSKISQKGGKVK